MKTAAQVAAEIRRIVAERIPVFECKGLCAPSCSQPFTMTVAERKVIKDEYGLEINKHQHLPPSRCNALGPANRCTVYEHRPAVCRMFGAVRDRMECGYGCLPRDKMISPEEMFSTFFDIFAAAGYMDPARKPVMEAIIAEQSAAGLPEHLRIQAAEGLAKVMERLALSRDGRGVGISGESEAGPEGPTRERPPRKNTNGSRRRGRPKGNGGRS